MSDNNKNISPIEIIPFEPLDQLKNTRRKRIPFKLLGVGVFFSVCIAFVVFTILARAVIFDLNPKNAVLQIHSLLSFNIGDNYLLLPGAHPVSAQADGYLVLEQNASVSNVKNQVIKLELKPLPGIVTFDANVEGVEVFLGDNNLGVSGEKIGELPLGEQKFELRKARYLSQTVALNVEGYGAEQNAQVSMQPAWGMRMIDSVPTGAQISVDGVEVGTTPLDIEILQNGSEVVLTQSNYEPWRKVLTAEPGSVAELDKVRLEKVYARFAIQSKPANANVTLNGVFQGKTPLELAAPSEKTHKLQIFSDGYETVTRSLKGGVGESSELQYTLKPIYGTVSINVFPKDAEIIINGQTFSGNPNAIRLPAKPQEVVVRKTGFVEQRRQITPKKNTTQLVNVTLLTPEESKMAAFPRSYKAHADLAMKLLRPDAVFTMGAPRREPGRRANETQKDVHLNAPFYVSLREVTNKQFRQFDANHNSKQISGQSLDLPEQPVVNISWETAARFCNWLSRADGFSEYYIENGDAITGINAESDGYRLPTEVEWAWMARVRSDGSVSRYAWGDSFPPSKVVANFKDLSANALLGSPIPNYQDNFIVSAPVGSFPANDKGVFDLGGNVSEWVNDYYEVGATHRGEPLLNPKGPETGEQRVIRGASWKLSGRSQLRLGYRDFAKDGREDVGFRVVRNVNIP